MLRCFFTPSEDAQHRINGKNTYIMRKVEPK